MDDDDDDDDDVHKWVLFNKLMLHARRLLEKATLFTFEFVVVHGAILKRTIEHFRLHRTHAEHRCGLLLHTAWSVYLSLCVGHDREPCKTAEPIEMPRVVLDGGPDLPRDGENFRDDVGISSHAVNQRSDWPAVITLNNYSFHEKSAAPSGDAT